MADEKAPDINETLRTEGLDAVRARMDLAVRYEGSGATVPPTGTGGVLRLAFNRDALPLLQISKSRYAELATRAEELLIEAGVEVFQRFGYLVRPSVNEITAIRSQKSKVAQLYVISKTYMRDLLWQYIAWETFDGRSSKWVPAAPPEEIAGLIIERVGKWRFRSISGVIMTPTLRPDGTILDQPGYDEATRLLLVDPPPMPAIPEAPTREDALAALGLLKGLIEEFPLNAVSRSVALSAQITAVVRGAFSNAPMHVANAPIPGSGKSYLWDLVSGIATGQPMPVISAGANEEEMEKRLGAALLAGQTLVSIDNVNGPLKSDALCQIIERPVVQVRMLGRSELFQIYASGNLMLATGNNIILVGDLCRRAVTAVLDPNVESPEMREFRGNPLESVLTNRGMYVAACLTVCRAYIAAGRPGKARRLGSFEEWSDNVRSALIWLGEADPLGSMIQAREDDPERAALRAMLSAWSEAIGVGYGNRIAMRCVIDKINETVPDSTDSGYSPRWPDLASAVRAAVASRIVDVKVLGIWARSKKGRIVGGRKFMSETNSKGVAKWWVEDVTTVLESAQVETMPLLPLGDPGKEKFDE
jgi:hypothetical protein